MRSAISTIGWGVFCACSWTWCIGMFLPRVMIDRFGIAGFLVFAIPNVLGCAGFGYMLARRAASEAMVRKHGPAMVVFSLVAVAYHVFFASLLFSELYPPAAGAPELAPVVGVGLLIVGFVLSFAPNRLWLLLAALVYLFSIFAFWRIGLGAWDRLFEPGWSSSTELYWFAPILCIGFLLCPYLDLTFHRALQNSASRHAFGVFGITFAVMILFTCFLWFAPGPVLPAIALAHILAQAVFTVGAHMREVRLSPIFRSRPAMIGSLILPLVALAILPVSRFVSSSDELGEEMYLRFLAFYGLAFPAYVLLFIGPWRVLTLSRPSVVLLAIIIVLLAPLYELGFIHHQAPLMAIPVGGMVIWTVARRSGRGKAAANAAVD